MLSRAGGQTTTSPVPSQHDDRQRELQDDRHERKGPQSTHGARKHAEKRVAARHDTTSDPSDVETNREARDAEAHRHDCEQPHRPTGHCVESPLEVTMTNGLYVDSLVTPAAMSRTIVSSLKVKTDKSRWSTI